MHIIVIDGKAFQSAEKDGQTVLEPIESGAFEIKGKGTDIRTLAQNRAMHLYFKQVADALNSAGLDMKQVIKADVQWTHILVKEMMWKPLQKALLGKESTTKLKKDEIDAVYHNLNRLLGQKFGIYVPFPSIDELILKYKEAI